MKWKQAPVDVRARGTSRWPAFPHVDRDGGVRDQSVLLLDVEVDVLAGVAAGAAGAAEPWSLEPDVVEAEPSFDEGPSVEPPLEAAGAAVLLEDESRESVR